MLRELTSGQPRLCVEPGVERSPSIFINGVGRLPVRLG